MASTVHPGQYATSLLFCTCIVTYLGLEAIRLQTLLRENFDPAQRHAAGKHSEPLAMTFPSVYSFFKDMAGLGLTLFLAFICENYPLFPQGQKDWDRDMYWFLVLLLLIVSLATLRKGKSTDILNRDQTEEWKGWMQFMFLMYHYYHAEEVYNAIRIMITCYVWMTGFGNFSFFYIKQDFGSVRLLQMLWRLNFLVVLLCLSQGNTYILYYICPLHTFFFFMVYVTMRIGPQRNHGKWDVRFKIFFLALCLYLMWDLFDGKVFNWLFSMVLGNEPCIGAKSGGLWEWYFRSSLDHYSTLLGMVFALNFPMATKFLAKVEELPFRYHFAVKAMAGALIAAPFFWWATNVFTLPKLEYNHTNSYYGFIPLLTYIYFRNLTPNLRMWHCGALHEVGKITLETYLMQHHIWLTSNAKTLLVLVPNYPKVNLVICTILFVYVSKQAFHYTMSLRGMVLPDDRRRCLYGAGGVVVLLGVLYTVGLVMSVAGLHPISVLVIGSFAAAALVVVLYRRLIASGAWSTGPSGSGASHSANLGGLWSGEGFKSLTSGATTLFVFAILLSMPIHSPGKAGPPAAVKQHVQSVNKAPQLVAEADGAGATRPALTPDSITPERCMSVVDYGTWNPEQCFNADASSRCTVESWRWAAAVDKCQFHVMKPDEARQLLEDKTVVVVGDSVGRGVYYSLLEAVGAPSKDAHGADAKQHADLAYKSGKVDVSFLWRPYAEEVADYMGVLALKEKPVDLLFMSFGLWDTLHSRSVPQFSQRLVLIEDMVGKLPVPAGPGTLRAMLLPTAVVDDRLKNPEKIEHMKEKDVTLFRDVLGKSGLAHKVDVVVDGYSLTKPLSWWSSDGVHYGDPVYRVLAHMLLNSFAASKSRPQHRLLEASGGAAKPKGGPRAIDGTMSSPAHGAFVLLVVLMMLVTMDSYAGCTRLALRLLGRSGVSWEEAYEPLLSKIMRAAPPTVQSRGRYSAVPVNDVELQTLTQAESQELDAEVRRDGDGNP